MIILKNTACMNAPNNTRSEIDRLTGVLEEHPGDATLYLQRGRLHHQRGEFDKALNDFIRAADLTASAEERKEAEGYIALIGKILSFHDTDRYNV